MNEATAALPAAPRIADTKTEYEPARKRPQAPLRITLALSTWLAIEHPPPPRDVGRGELAELEY